MTPSDELPVTRWTVTVEEDPETGELILPLPADLLTTQGWVDGDTLEWKEGENGEWFLSKVKEHK
jgi:hypothetical protein